MRCIMLDLGPDATMHMYVVVDRTRRKRIDVERCVVVASERSLRRNIMCAYVYILVAADAECV